MAEGKSSFKDKLSNETAKFKKYRSADPFYAMQKLLLINDEQLVKALREAGEASYDQTKEIYDRIAKEYKKCWNPKDSEY